MRCCRYARRCFSDAVLVGVFSGRDRRPYLNPGDDMEIHEGDRLIVLSQTSAPLRWAADAAPAYQPTCRLPLRHSAMHPMSRAHVSLSGRP